MFVHTPMNTYTQISDRLRKWVTLPSD